MKNGLSGYFLRTLFVNNVLAAALLSSQMIFAADTAMANVVTCTDSQCPLAIPALTLERLNEQAVVYQTSSGGKWMEQTSQAFTGKNNGGWHYIVINESDLKDTAPIIGFGGAFTDSASMLFGNMSKALQNALIKAYFSAQGIEYSLGRVPMASNDFSCRQVIEKNGKSISVPRLNGCSDLASQYSYADEPDLNLTNFALQPEDLEYKIPMIKSAMQAVEENTHQPLRLFASPWSAPAWMKSNYSMVHGNLWPQYQQVWSDYFIKFFRAYRAQQIRFWGVTVQNEPVDSGYLGKKFMQTWQTMYSTEMEEGNFVKAYLGPALRQFEQEYGSKINLMVHDDQVTTIQRRMTMLDDPEVAQYVDGAGLHWYMNLDRYYGNLDDAYQALNKRSGVNKKFILGTEACEGYLPLMGGPSLGSWSRGEAYAHDIISDLNHSVSGWMDWNLVLDMQGGPNWANNKVDAPILADLSTQTLYIQPMYFYLGHFSKFLRPESVMLASQSKGPFPLEEVAFKVPAHGNIPETITLVVLNRDFSGRNYYIQDNSREGGNIFLNLYIPAHGIQTIIFKSQSK